MLEWIDYRWFVGEAFHRRKGSPGDDEALLMGCWYMGAFLPLLTFFHRVLNGWWFCLVAAPVLLLAPFVFCCFRYTAKRRNKIWARFREHRHMGRRLLAIGAVMAAICSLEIFLMPSFRLLVRKPFVTRFNTLSFPLISMNLSTVVELQR